MFDHIVFLEAWNTGQAVFLGLASIWILIQRKRINMLSRSVVREAARRLEERNQRRSEESRPSETWLQYNGLTLVDHLLWQRMVRDLKALESEAEWCKAHMHEYQIGAAIEKACKDLPERMTILVELEKEAGTATLRLPDGIEWRSMDNENFAAEIGACVVKAQNWKPARAERWSPEEVALFVERNEKPLTLNKIEEDDHVRFE